jgi:hypothetical protein
MRETVKIATSEETIDNAHKLSSYFQQRLFGTIAGTIGGALESTFEMYNEWELAEARSFFEHLLSLAMNDCRLSLNTYGLDAKPLLFRLQEYFIRADVEMLQGRELTFDSADVQSACGTLYLNHERLKRDPVKAAVWLEKAASQDNVYSLYTLAQLHINSELPSPDFGLAIGLLERASLLGDRDAPQLLTWLYREGKKVSRDDRAALRWAKIGAERGSLFCQAQLGLLYFEGLIIQRNVVEAAAWMILSRSGAGDMSRNADAVLESLSPSDQARARARAVDLKHKLQPNNQR